MLQEFKKFAMRGNVVDMAVGIILGAAFGKIVASVVNDVVMPPIGLLVGGVDFSNLTITLKDAVLSPAGELVTEAVQIRYGVFINVVIDFLIVALVVFMVVRAMNRMKKAEHKPEPTEKKCPHCCSTIHLDATKCPQCTSALEAAA